MIIKVFDDQSPMANIRVQEAISDRRDKLAVVDEKAVVTAGRHKSNQLPSWNGQKTVTPDRFYLRIWGNYLAIFGRNLLGFADLEAYMLPATDQRRYLLFDAFAGLRRS